MSGRRVAGTPQHALDRTKADVNTFAGRHVLWWRGEIALAMEGDMNRNTGEPWTATELYGTAEIINRSVQPWWRRWLP